MKKLIQFQKLKIKSLADLNNHKIGFESECYYKLNLNIINIDLIRPNIPNNIECFIECRINTMKKEVQDFKINVTTVIPNKQDIYLICDMFREILFAKQKNMFNKVLNRKKDYFKIESEKLYLSNVDHCLDGAISSFIKSKSNLTFKEYVEEFLNKKNIKDVLGD